MTHSSGALTLGRQRMPKGQSLSYSDGIPASGILGHDSMTMLAGCQLEADTRSIDLAEDGRSLRLKTLDPKFMPLFGGAVNTAFANVIDMSFYGASDLVAEVIPEGDHSLVRAIGGTGLEEWRFSRSGMTYLASHKGLVHSS